VEGNIMNSSDKQKMITIIIEFCLLKIRIKKIEWRDSWTGGIGIYEPSHE